MSWVTPDGARAGERPRLDPMHYGWGPLCRLYRTSDGWLCLTVVTSAQWSALCRVIGLPRLASDVRFADATARAANAGDLASELEKAIAERSAPEWCKLLDAAGVPCEISDPEFVMSLFDDPELREKGWVTRYEHASVGRWTSSGCCSILSRPQASSSDRPPWSVRTRARFSRNSAMPTQNR